MKEEEEEEEEEEEDTLAGEEDTTEGMTVVAVLGSAIPSWFGSSWGFCRSLSWLSVCSCIVATMTTRKATTQTVSVPVQ